MACCGCDDRPNEEADEEAGPTKPDRRGCTDMLCCCMLLVYWIGMVLIFAVALMLGNPYSVVYGKDYGGFRCGLDGEGVPTAATSKVYFPQLSADLAHQSHLLHTPWKLHLYGVCVKECPRKGQRVLDYGCAQHKLYPGASPTACKAGHGAWTVPLDTQDVANRCMPKKEREGNSTLLCALPNCVQARRRCYTASYPLSKFWPLDPTDMRQLEQCVTQVRVGTTLEFDAAGAGPAEAKLAQSMRGMNQLVLAVMSSWRSILTFGVGLPVAVSFAFIVSLRVLAGPLVYAAIYTLLLVMLCATAACSYRAGLFGAQLGGLIEQHANSTLVQEALEAASGVYGSARAAYEDSGYSAYLDVAVPDLGQLNLQVYRSVALGLLVADAGLLAFVCLFSQQLGVAIAVIEEGSAVIGAQPFTLLYPFVTVVALCFLFAYFLIGGVFIGTLNNDSLESALTNFTGELSRLQEQLGEEFASSLPELSGISPDTDATIKQVLGAYHLFGFLWASNFLLAASTMVVAGSVSFWFFSRNNSAEYPRAPLLSSLHMVLRYHLGTAAFGALCLAVAQLLRAALELVNDRVAQAEASSLVLRFSMSCVRCAMWCFEKCVKFVSGYAYIYVALNGDSFCSASKATYALFLNYPAQVAVNAFVQTLLRVLQCVALPIVCALACFYCAEEVYGSRNPMLPSALTLALAFVISRVFSGVYETTIDTIFVCAMRDKDQFEGRHTPKYLAAALKM